MFKFLKDILAPKKCYSCKKQWHFLCDDCVNNLSSFESICYECKWLSKNFEIHKNCKSYNVYYDKIVIFTHYKEKIVSKLVKDLKFYWVKDIAEDFWKYMSMLFLDNEIYKNTDNYIIVFPPMSLFKKFKRWYNHSELIAKYISNNTWININKSILKKNKNSRQQSKLTREERLVNLEKSFKINKKYIDKLDNMNFIIVDDVISTWTTINEISKILKNNGANKIIWLIFASD